MGHGYVEGLAGLSLTDGAFAKVEAGYRPLTNLGLFADAQTNFTTGGTTIEGGARFTF